MLRRSMRGSLVVASDKPKDGRAGDGGKAAEAGTGRLHLDVEHAALGSALALLRLNDVPSAHRPSLGAPGHHADRGVKRCYWVLDASAGLVNRAIP